MEAKESTVKEKRVAEEAPSAKSAASDTSKRIEEINEQVEGQDIDAEQEQEMLEDIVEFEKNSKATKKGAARITDSLDSCSFASKPLLSYASNNSTNTSKHGPR